MFLVTVPALTRGDPTQCRQMGEVLQRSTAAELRKKGLKEHSDCRLSPQQQMSVSSMDATL